MRQIPGKIYNVRLLLILAWRMYNANNTSGSYHRYVRKIAGEIINLSLNLNDGNIPERAFRKIQWYMVEAVIMGEMLARLADRKITERDRESLVYLGAIMALFDIFTDDFRYDNKRMMDILDITFSSTFQADAASESAIENVYHLYLGKLLHTIDQEHWGEIGKYLDIIKLQIESSMQYMNDAPEESVKKITIGKGGVSVLIFSVFLGQKDEQFKSALFETGGFIQMMNDCQDLYKDTLAGIKTFVHFCGSFQDIFNRLNVQRVITFRKIDSLELNLYDRYRTIYDLNAMFIMISYKLHRYAETCNYSLDFDLIAKMDSKDFRINPFSLKAFYNCTGRIINFNPRYYENVSAFKFSA